MFEVDGKKNKVRYSCLVAHSYFNFFIILTSAWKELVFKVSNQVRLKPVCSATYTSLYTGQPCYVKLAYLEYTAYVEVIIYSRAFPLYCCVFQTCLCRTWLSRNLSYIEVVFHSRKLVFCVFTTTYVKVNFVLVTKLHNMNVKQSN